MAGKKSQRSATRKAKYQSQFSRTESNKRHNINKMKLANPNWPARKAK